jgi:hypothetical protein
MSSVPTVLVLESFEEYAKKSRQVLLYTLLDLMHRRDLLFVVSLSIFVRVWLVTL